MRALSTTALPHLEFKRDGEQSMKTRAVSDRIGWLHTISDKPGSNFDITIKDALGRVKLQKNNCKTQTNEYGELVNLPTLLGEELHVEISNLKESDNLKVFLN